MALPTRPNCIEVFCTFKQIISSRLEDIFLALSNSQFCTWRCKTMGDITSKLLLLLCVKVWTLNWEILWDSFRILPVSPPLFHIYSWNNLSTWKYLPFLITWFRSLIAHWWLQRAFHKWAFFSLWLEAGTKYITYFAPIILHCLLQEEALNHFELPVH